MKKSGVILTKIVFVQRRFPSTVLWKNFYARFNRWTLHEPNSVKMNVIYDLSWFALSSILAKFNVWNKFCLYHYSQSKKSGCETYRQSLTIFFLARLLCYTRLVYILTLSFFIYNQPFKMAPWRSLRVANGSDQFPPWTCTVRI